MSGDLNERVLRRLCEVDAADTDAAYGADAALVVRAWAAILEAVIDSLPDGALRNDAIEAAIDMLLVGGGDDSS